MINMDENYYKDQFDINWADETNSETLTREKLHSDKFTLIQVNISDVFDKSGTDYALDIHDPSGGKNVIGDRLDKAKEHYMSGEPMDHPIVEYNYLYQKTSFTNGRHRTLAAAQMGCSYIPMLVYNENLEDFKSNVRTKSMDVPLEQATYVNNSDDTLKINWANGNNSSPEIKEMFKNDSHMLIQVNVEKAFANIDDYDLEEDLYFKPGRDPSLSEEIEQAKEMLLNNESVDFPTMGSNIQRDHVEQLSGRAITMAAYDLGCKFVPMLVEKENLSHFQSIVETRGMDERLDTPAIEKADVSKSLKNRLS